MLFRSEILAFTYNFTSETTKLQWQRSARLRALKDALGSLNSKEHIKKDPIKYFVEKFLHFCTYFENNTDETAFSLRATPCKYRPKCGKAQKIKIALLLHTDRL